MYGFNKRLRESTPGHSLGLDSKRAGQSWIWILDHSTDFGYLVFSGSLDFSVFSGFGFLVFVGFGSGLFHGYRLNKSIS